MPAHGADSAVTVADWSIVFRSDAQTASVIQSRAHDMSVALFNPLDLTQFVLTLGSGGTDPDHEEVSVAIDNGSAPLQWVAEFIDNTHRLLRCEQNAVPTRPSGKIHVAIRRLQRGGEP